MRDSAVPCQRLGDLAAFEYGRALPSTVRTGSGYPVFGSGGLVGHHSQPMIDGPAIVVGRKGTVGSVMWSPGPCWPIDTTYWVRPLRDLNIRWLYEVLQILDLKKLDTSTGIPGLNRKDAYEALVAVPPIVEQRRIVEVLGACTEMERVAQRQLAKLNVIRQAQIDSMGSGTIPLEGLLQRIESGWSPVCESRKPGADDWGVLSLSAVTSGRFRPEEAKRLPQGELPRKHLEINQGDVLMARGNGARSLVGVGCVVQDRCSRLIFPDLVYRLVADQERLDPKFLGMAIASGGFRRQVDATMRSTSGQYKISKTDVRRFTLPDLSLDEQRKIVAEIGVIDSRMSVQSDEIAKLRKVKQGLTDDLLTGRMRVDVLG